MPKDLEDSTGEAYKDKIYKDYPYLKYIEKQYKVDVSPGMMFTNKNDALNEYRNNGGVLTEIELEELDFNKIHER